MADETNDVSGIPTDEDSSGSDSTEVESSITMRIDAPEAEVPNEVEHKEDVVSLLSPCSLIFPPDEPSSSSDSLGSYSSESSGSISESPGPKPVSFQPSQLADATDEVPTTDSAEQLIGLTIKEDNSEEPSPTPDPRPIPDPSSFVFGENVHARTASTADAMESLDSASGLSQSLPETSLDTSNDTNEFEMLFTNALKASSGHTQLLFETSQSDSSATGSHKVEKLSKSLSEAAAELEESRNNKRKYEEVTVVTGEEHDVNIMQMNCRLYAFDNATSSWVELGMGMLRLNDTEAVGGVQSRVVIRATGSLRVMVNTKIWGGMSVERPSDKSIRLTALESSGQIKVFLVKASPTEIDSMFELLETRVARCSVTEASAFQNKRLDAGDQGTLPATPDDLTPKQT